ncbi:MAG: hypothetical protein VX871_11265 [Pseudomonadota bacterium]|nr:hypothetical protein [Pseudomonadota bacterium]
MRKTLIIAALAVGMATPAFAFHCPKDMSAIDEAMKTATLSDADKAKVTELRAKGEEQHKAGDHAASVKTLGEAKEMLGIK